MSLTGGQHQALLGAISEYLRPNPAAIDCVLNGLSQDEKKLQLSDIILVTHGGSSMPDVAAALLNWAETKGSVGRLCTALKACNANPDLHRTIESIERTLGPAEQPGPKRWAKWLEQVPPPRVQEVNPYHPFTLNLTKAELGEAYVYPEPKILTPAQRAGLPPYVRRKEDDKLDRIFKGLQGRGALVLLVGASKAGKSRSAYEALLRHGSDRRLLIPRGHAAVREILVGYGELEADLKIDRGSAVLWLDNLHEVLTEQYLLADPEIDRRLLRLVDEHGLLVMATIWDREFDALRQEPEAKVKREGKARGEEIGAAARRLAQRLFAWAEPMTVKLDCGRGACDDHDLAAAYPRETFSEIWKVLEGKSGLAEALIAWPELLKRFLDANEPARRALLRAAADLRRAGIDRPIPRASLEALFPAYLEEEPYGDEWEGGFEGALKSAKKRVGQYQRLLTPASHSAAVDTHAYLLYDRLVYYLDDPAVCDNYPLLPAAWDEALRLCGEEVRSLNGVATSACYRKRVDIAATACRKGVELGDGRAASNLGWLLEEQGKTDEAEAAYRTGVERGSAAAASNLAFLLIQQGREDEAWKSLITSIDMLGPDIPYVERLKKLHDEIGPLHYMDMLRLITGED